MSIDTRIDLVTLYCPQCQQDNLAEEPPCSDGHDGCPELACIQCGHAFVVMAECGDSYVLLTTVDAAATMTDIAVAA